MAALVAAEGLTKERERKWRFGTSIRASRLRADCRRARRVGQRRQRDGVAGGLRANHATAPDDRDGSEPVGSDGRPAESAELVDGDVVYVAKRMLRPIYVIGLVRKPGEFPYPTTQEVRVLDALALAGGASNPVAEDIMVIRQLPNQKEPVRIAVSLQGAKNVSESLTLRLSPDTVRSARRQGQIHPDVLRPLKAHRNPHGSF